MMINLGIDLGTTNSAIALFEDGKVRIFSNPQDFGRSTLPSVVGFRKSRTLVGNKARELWEKDPGNVFGIFKRKMGTAERFHVQVSGEEKSPIDLSALVLQELKLFLPHDLPADAAVITIPASFDTIQSNATKAAGYRAGFQQVELLQEPIAASLAYANSRDGSMIEEGRWIVYDLGGGTFDVALLQIKNEEMRVLDHEGDNFLGGTDFDKLIVDKLVLPRLAAQYRFAHIEEAFKSAAGAYNAWYYVLLRAAEDAKIQLSSYPTADLLVEGFADEEGTEVELEIRLRREEFEELIHGYIEQTLGMMRVMLQRNTLKPTDVDFVLLVGGSTYIPYVGQRISESLKLAVNTDIDPTTCVAEGAAFYAATRRREVASAQQMGQEEAVPPITLAAAYARTSKSRDELFTARVSGDITALYYRITREGGGYDSGLKPLQVYIEEDLPLVPNAFNVFKIRILDAQNNEVPSNMGEIGINSGYGISGQPLPQAISLEIDDEEETGQTRLLPIFDKNAILPLRKSITRMVNRNLQKGQEGELLRVNILEGPVTASPEACKKIGYIAITGEQLSRDVIKGSDVDIFIAVSESRDLTVSVHIAMTGQDFTQTFVPTERHTSHGLLALEAKALRSTLNEEMRQATKSEDYGLLAQFSHINEELSVIENRIQALHPDDNSDERYQLEDQRRTLAQRLDEMTQSKRYKRAVEEYYEAKKSCRNLLASYHLDSEGDPLKHIVADEPDLISAGIVSKLEAKKREMYIATNRLLFSAPAFLSNQMYTFSSYPPASFTNPAEAERLVSAGHAAMASSNWNALAHTIGQLYGLLPPDAPSAFRSHKIGF